jgi:hypothetical protein
MISCLERCFHAIYVDVCVGFSFVRESFLLSSIGIVHKYTDPFFLLTGRVSSIWWISSICYIPSMQKHFFGIGVFHNEHWARGFKAKFECH